MLISRYIPLTVLLVLSLLSVGCQSTPGYAWDEPYHGLLHRPAGQARSLVMDADRQAALAMAGGAEGFDPWYVGRNDLTPSVIYGERVQVSEISFSRTRDGQDSYRGEIIDRYNQSTYRERVIETRR